MLHNGRRQERCGVSTLEAMHVAEHRLRAQSTEHRAVYVAVEKEVNENVDMAIDICRYRLAPLYW